MKELNGLGKELVAIDPIKIKLDKTVKKILAYKPLLARIFKEVVIECKDMTHEEIKKCIEGEVQISEVYVDSGLSNSGERISGQNIEDYINEEGLDKYDIRTFLRLPDEGGKRIKILINLEAQNEDKPGYDIIRWEEMRLIEI